MEIGQFSAQDMIIFFLALVIMLFFFAMFSNSFGVITVQNQSEALGNTLLNAVNKNILVTPYNDSTLGHVIASDLASGDLSIETEAKIISELNLGLIQFLHKNNQLFLDYFST